MLLASMTSSYPPHIASSLLSGAKTGGPARESAAYVQPNYVLNSRFGTVEINPDTAIYFSRGLLGLPQYKTFALADFPGKGMESFHLLQSLDEEKLSFIALPIGIENPLIDASDIRAAIAELKMDENNLALLLIVSVQRTPGAIRMTVNTRAPVFIDSRRRTGVQYVFSQERYQVQYALDTAQ